MNELTQKFIGRPVHALPPPFKSLVDAMAAQQTPSDHWVVYGTPGNFFAYLKKILGFLFFVFLFLVLAALAVGIIVVVVSKSPEGRTTGLSIAFGGGVTLSFMLFFILIPNLIVRWRYKTILNNPGKNALALGPEGLLIVSQSIFGTRATFLPWADIQTLRLRSFNSLGYLLQLGSGLLGPALAETYQYPLSVIQHTLQAGWRQFQKEGNVSIDEVLKAIDPAYRGGKPLISQPLPLTLTGNPPAEWQQVIHHLSNRQYYDGTQTFLWNRTPRSLFRVAMILLLTMPLILPLLVTPWIFLYYFFYRGPKGSWLISFLPDGLLLQDAQGMRCIPWSAIQDLAPQGRGVTLKFSSGRIVLELDSYGLSPEGFLEIAKSLRNQG